MTPGRKKLAQLGIQLPMLPTMTTGSFPKTPELIELRYKVSQGVLQMAELERKERIGIELWLREQQRLGLNVSVDGELERGDFIGYFSDRIEGFERGGRVRIHENRYYRKPIIKGKLSWKMPLISDSWPLTQRATHTPVKAVLTGPYTLMDFSFNEFYSSREGIMDDLVAILKKEINALSEAGAKIIQIDEPALSAHPDEFSLVADALKELTKNQKAYFILHQSYGEPGPLWKKIEKLPVDNFSFEAANSNMSILSFLKKSSVDKDFTIGIIDSTRSEVETPAIVKQRAMAALKVIPAPRLWFSTDSGMKSFTPETTIEKLDVLNKTVSKIRLSLKAVPK